LSVFSIGSSTSLGSALSSSSRWSVMSHKARRSILILGTGSVGPGQRAGLDRKR
jgi:hypothetical protein